MKGKFILLLCLLVLILSFSLQAQYCVPVPNFNSTSPKIAWVKCTRYTSLLFLNDDPAGASPTNYYDLTSTYNADLILGDTHHLELLQHQSNPWPVVNAYWKAWIDFDGDLTFEASEVILESLPTSQTLEYDFVVPVNATQGTTRLRLIVSD